MRGLRTSALVVAAPLIFVLPALRTSSPVGDTDAASRPRLPTVVTAPHNGAVLRPTNRPTVVVRGKTRHRVDRVRVLVRRANSDRWLRPSRTAQRSWYLTQGTRRWAVRLRLEPGTYVVETRAVRDGRVAGTPDRLQIVVQGRDPLRWPYPSDSFWNMPRGLGAQLVPFNMTPPEKTFRAEEDLLFMAPDLPPQQWTSIAPHSAGWRGDRCFADWSAKLRLGNDTSFPMPPLVPGQQSGLFPNHSTAIVMPDYTLRETQPLAVCALGITSQYASPRWQGDSLLTGGHGASPDGRTGGGSHGGSFMTAYGGTIRLGEWVRGGNIPHATKIEVYSQMWLTQNREKFSGYRWPALAADSSWSSSSGYGTLAPSSRPPDAVMGALLTLPVDFPMLSLRTEPARILARSIRDYGTYIVDGTGRPTVAFATEWSSEGRVLEEFQTEFGFSPVGDHQSGVASPQNDFFADLNLIYRNLHIVADNRHDNVGGAGPPMALPAPPIEVAVP